MQFFKAKRNECYGIKNQKVIRDKCTCKLHFRILEFYQFPLYLHPFILPFMESYKFYTNFTFLATKLSKSCSNKFIDSLKIHILISIMPQLSRILNLAGMKLGTIITIASKFERYLDSI